MAKTRGLVLGLVAVASLAAAADKHAFTGVVTDSMCETGDHSGMRMGATDAECTVACIQAHGATYVLASGKDVLRLSDQRAPEGFAGRRVRVVGSLDAKTKTIAVDSIAAARPAKR
jgi:hypothetical protein